MKGSCDAANTTSAISKLCVGKSTCYVYVSDTFFGDPCYNTVKWLDVEAQCSSGSLSLQATVPVNTVAQVLIPYNPAAGTAGIAVTEGGAAVYGGGAYRPGVPGVTNAYLVPASNALGVDVGSGTYNFVLTQ